MRRGLGTAVAIPRLQVILQRLFIVLVCKTSCFELAEVSLVSMLFVTIVFLLQRRPVLLIT